MPPVSDERDRILEAAEEAPAGTWLEAAERLIEQQEALQRQELGGGVLGRGEARRHLLALQSLRALLRSDKSLIKRRLAHEPSSDPLVRRMRRADLLCPKGWRETIRKLLIDTADASEREYLTGGKDQDVVDSLVMRDFVAQLDHVATRGEKARLEYARQAMKVA